MDFGRLDNEGLGLLSITTLRCASVILLPTTARAHGHRWSAAGRYMHGMQVPAPPGHEPRLTPSAANRRPAFRIFDMSQSEVGNGKMMCFCLAQSETRMACRVPGHRTKSVGESQAVMLTNSTLPMYELSCFVSPCLLLLWKGMRSIDSSTSTGKTHRRGAWSTGSGLACLSEPSGLHCL